MNREKGLDRLASEKDWDILIIGGGATGLGAALDAASRGHRTVLLERGDFAQGTSSRSTKLVHGGVRYLKQGNISLVKGALRERGLLFQNVPHLVNPIPFIIPSHHWWEGPYFATGLKFYDWLAGDLGIEDTKLLGKESTLEEIPKLRSEKLKGGVKYWDGQFDDARLAVDFATTIWQQDGLALNYVEVKELIKGNGRISGAISVDSRNGKTYQINAKCVINATGVFSDSIRKLDNQEAQNIIKASQGAHIVLDRDKLPMNSALIVPKTTDGRVLFAIPWHNRIIVGTTDTPVDSIEQNPQPFPEEIGFIVENAQNYLDVTLKQEDIKSVYAGLRPLVSLKSGKGSTAQLSRDHYIEISESGLVSIAGGKWTTYRKMGEDVVNRAEISADLESRHCVTKNLPIHTSQPKPQDKTLHPALPYSKNQIEASIESEMPLTLEDVLSRRTRAQVLDLAAAKEIAPFIADLMVEKGVLAESEKAAHLAEFDKKAGIIPIL